jgi:hypothetical protein
VARYRGNQYIAGHRLTADADERLSERQRVWQTYRADTLDPPTKADFDAFWERENGVRALFLMDTLTALPAPLQFKTYGRALEWGYPLGVGHRYLTLSQCSMLLRAGGLSSDQMLSYLQPLTSR